jgi:hypothetical protein
VVAVVNVVLNQYFPMSLLLWLGAKRIGLLSFASVRRLIGKDHAPTSALLYASFAMKRKDRVRVRSELFLDMEHRVVSREEIGSLSDAKHLVERCGVRFYIFYHPYLSLCFYICVLTRNAADMIKALAAFRTHFCEQVRSLSSRHKLVGA